MTGDLRYLANCAAKAQACQRDKYIDQHGICVTAMIPLNSEGQEYSDVDFFGDKCASNRKDKPLSLVPQYRDYYQLLDILGDEDIENPLPLECLVKSTDHWPMDTIFRLPVLNKEGILQDRYWRVISQEQKHLELGYAKRIKAVPARDHTILGKD